MNGNALAVSAALVGVCLAVQAAANGAFRRNLNDPLWATFFSVCGTIVFASVAMLAIRPPAPAMDAVRSTSWWNWVGGPLGTLVVLGGAYLARPLGTATFIALVIGGQLVTALLLDHFAVMNLPERPLSLGRAAGAALILGGVACVWYHTPAVAP